MVRLPSKADLLLIVIVCMVLDGLGWDGMDIYIPCTSACLEY